MKYYVAQLYTDGIPQKSYNVVPIIKDTLIGTSYYQISYSTFEEAKKVCDSWNNPPKQELRRIYPPE